MRAAAGSGLTLIEICTAAGLQTVAVAKGEAPLLPDSDDSAPETSQRLCPVCLAGAQTTALLPVSALPERSPGIAAPVIPGFDQADTAGPGHAPRPPARGPPVYA